QSLPTGGRDCVVVSALALFGRSKLYVSQGEQADTYVGVILLADVFLVAADIAVEHRNIHVANLSDRRTVERGVAFRQSLEDTSLGCTQAGNVFSLDGHNCVLLGLGHDLYSLSRLTYHSLPLGWVVLSHLA